MDTPKSGHDHPHDHPGRAGSRAFDPRPQKPPAVVPLKLEPRDDSKAWRDRRAKAVGHSPDGRMRLLAAGLLALKAQADGKPFSIELPTHAGKPRVLSADDIFAELARLAGGPRD